MSLPGRPRPQSAQPRGPYREVEWRLRRPPAAQSVSTRRTRARRPLTPGQTSYGRCVCDPGGTRVGHQEPTVGPESHANGRSVARERNLLDLLPVSAEHHQAALFGEAGNDLSLGVDRQIWLVADILALPPGGYRNLGERIARRAELLNARVPGVS